MRRVAISVILLGSLVGSVHAQKKSDDPYVLEQEQQKKDALDIDKQYKATLQRTNRDRATTETRASDPWSNMRGADDSKTKR